MFRKGGVWFSGVLILLSLAFAGCIGASTPGAKSPEKLGEAILQALKNSSADDYMKFVRTKKDWKNIIKSSTFSENEKKNVVREKSEKLEKNRSFAKSAFEDTLASAKSFRIEWNNAKFKELTVDFQHETVGVKEMDYDVVFSVGNKEYSVTMLGVAQTKRGWTLNTLYKEVKRLTVEVKPALDSLGREVNPPAAQEKQTIGSLISDLVKSDLCKQYVVGIKGLKSVMILAGDQNNSESLKLINENRAQATVVVMEMLRTMGQLEGKDQEPIERLVIETLDAECKVP